MSTIANAATTTGSTAVRDFAALAKLRVGSLVVLSSAVGAVLGGAMLAIQGRDRAQPIPFGPYLAAAGWITMLWGGTLKNAYLDLFL